MGEEGEEALPGCRLYLVTPLLSPAGGLDAEAFAPVLAATLDAGDVASLLLRCADASDDAARRAADRLRPVTQDRGVAVLLEDRPDLVAATGADGVHLARGEADVIAARRLLGPDMIVGAACAVSRHRAMVAAERGADYVAFGDPGALDARSGSATGADDETMSLVAWWSALMTVPCVAFANVAPADIGPLVRAGADFLALGARLWEWPDGPEAGLRAYLAAIAEAQEMNGKPPGD